MKKAIFGQKGEDHNNKSSNRASAVLSICSYENINFAPLAKPESMSDINNDSMIENSFKSSFLRLRDDTYDERKKSEEEIVATSTPRNGEDMNSNSKINLSVPEFNYTSLSMLNAQMNSSSYTTDNNSQQNSINSVNLTFSNNSKTNDSNLQNMSFLLDDINFSSIDKLEILKPKSKDYILCFNTSVDTSIASSKTNGNHSSTEEEKIFEKKFDSGIDIRNVTGSVYSNCK